MNAKINIREADAKDLDAIVLVENACFPKDIRYSRDKISQRLAHHADSGSKARKYFVAEKEKKIVGYGEVAIQDYSFALFNHTVSVDSKIRGIDGYVGVLVSLAVHPAERDQGIGSELINARIDYLKKQGIKHVFAHSWPRGGFPALAKKHDFTPIPEWNGKTYPDGTKAVLYYKLIR